LPPFGHIIRAFLALVNIMDKGRGNSFTNISQKMAAEQFGKCSKCLNGIIINEYNIF
jgi:hypothetical protein